MALPIIPADQRLAEPRGIKSCIFGKSGVGKTSLLWTLRATTTLFFDLEAGDLAVEGWPGDTIRPSGIIKAKQATSKSRWVVIDVIVRNQNDEPVATGEAMVEFPLLAKAGRA